MITNASRKGMVVLAAVAMLICAHSNRAAGFDGILQGTVKNSSGAPVSGAFVRLKSEDRHLTYLVISQAQGRYTASDLPAAKYTVQGIANGFQSEPAMVDVAEGRPATLDVSLTANQPAMLPPYLPLSRGDAKEDEDVAILKKKGPLTLPEGDGKKIVGGKCIQCHGIERALTRHFSRARWEATVSRMRDFARTGSQTIDLTDQEAKVAVDYLTANFPPLPEPPVKVDPNSRFPRTPVQGDAMRYRVVTYDVPAPVRSFHEIAVDVRGNAWVNEQAGGRTGTLGKLDAKTLTFSEVTAPATGATPGTRVILNGMEKGQGDQLWTMDTLNRRLMRYDAKTGEFNVFIVPKLKRGSPNTNSIRVHPDGTVWFAAIQSNAVVNFNPVSQKFSVYDVPSGVKTGLNSMPYSMAIAGDGKVWFAEYEFDKIGKLDPATGKVEEFPIPLKWDGPIHPRKVGYDGNGDIWAGLEGAGKLMKIDHKTNAMTIYTPPTAKAGIYGIGADRKTNMIWVAEDSVDKIARFDPKTETFTEYPLPYAEMDMRRVEVDPTNSNRVWFSGVASNKIGYIELLDANGKPL